MATWVTPTELNYVTSHFNPNRKHPITGRIKPHTGTDYRAPTGTDIRAASDGVVVRSLYSAAVTGHYIRIDHGNGVWTGYSHLSARLVAVGDRVVAGEVIGRSGATGSAVGAHLHFEVSVKGIKINPLTFLGGVNAVNNVITVPGGNIPVIEPGTLPTLGDDLDTMDAQTFQNLVVTAISGPAGQRALAEAITGAEARYQVRNPIKPGEVFPLAEGVSVTLRYAIMAYTEAYAANRKVNGEEIDIAEVAAALAPLLVEALTNSVVAQIDGIEYDEVKRATEESMRAVLGSLG